MKEIFAALLVVYLFISFVLVGFGAWHFTTLIMGMVVGLVYTLLT